MKNIFCGLLSFEFLFCRLLYTNNMNYCRILCRLKEESFRLNIRNCSVLCNENKHNSPNKRKVLISHKIPIRNISIQGVVEWQQNLYSSISNSYVVTSMQDGLIYFHESTGLPWWASIITSTIIIRACMTFPLAIYQNYILAKVENASLELQSLIDELKKETAIAKKVYNLTDRQTINLYRSSLKKQWRNIIERDNCHPLKASLVIFLQIPIWFCMSFALRNIVYMQPVTDAAALLSFTELSVGGFGWIPNLTQPDHSLILPVAFGLTNLAIIELQRLSKLRKPSKIYNIFTNVFRGFTILMIPMAMYVPSCMCLYWFTSSSFGLIQNIILLSPNLRRKLKIPDAPSELEDPYNHIKDEIRHKLKKMSLTKK